MRDARVFEIERKKGAPVGPLFAALEALIQQNPLQALSLAFSQDVLSLWPGTSAIRRRVWSRPDVGRSDRVSDRGTRI